MSTRRARSASRRAAPVGAWAAATKPSQRQTSPSSDTSRWPVLSCDTSSAPRSFGDDADLRQPARQFGRRLRHGRRAASTPSGSAGSPSVDAGTGPAHRRRRIDRRVEIVAERGAERLLVALGDGDAVDDRRPQVLGLAVDELGDACALRSRAAARACRLRSAARARLPASARAATWRGFGWPAPRLRDCASVCCAVSIAPASAARSPSAAGLLRELLLVALDVGDFLVEPRQPVAMGCARWLRAGCAWR